MADPCEGLFDTTQLEIKISDLVTVTSTTYTHVYQMGVSGERGKFVLANCNCAIVTLVRSLIHGGGC